MAQPNPIEQAVRETATKLGVDPDFAARIAYQESRYNPKATSPKGAQGVMQVMPATAKDLAPRYGNDNIAQGIGYLKDLGQMFDAVPEAQRPHFVAAAYNAGPGRVLDLMEKAKAAGQDPYNIASLADALPGETLQYVANLADMVGPKGKSLRPIVSTTQTPATAKIESFGTALYRSLAHEGERQRAAVGRAIEGAKGLVRPTGEATPGQALKASGRAVLGALDALQPVIAPTMTAGSVGGETAARTGALPVSPETGATLGALGTAFLSPSSIAAEAKMIRPIARASDRLVKFLSAPGLGAAGASAVMGNPSAYGAAAALLLARGGTKALDAMLSSKAGIAAIHALGKYGQRSPVKRLIGATLGRATAGEQP